MLWIFSMPSSARLMARLAGLSFLMLGTAQSAEPIFGLGEPPVAPRQDTGPITRTVSPVQTSPVVVAAPSITSISLSTRAASRAFYYKLYVPSENAVMNWTGSLAGVPGESATGTPGTTALAYRRATLQRINWFRAMAGVPANITLRSDYSGQDQQAALMMAANNMLDHTPPKTWLLYTAAGALAAQNSNLALGWTGPDAIDAYMLDYGANNSALGHRRWLLYPQTQVMGVGDIPWTGDFYCANAVWVVDDHFYDARPTTRDGYVAWPPPGFVPSTTVYPRWSFAYPGADFSEASVTMTSGETSVPVALEPPDNPGYGENTLAWVWKGIDATRVYTVEPPPAQDTLYLVRVDNVTIAGRKRNFTYTVTIFDPNVGDALYQPDLAVADWGQANWQGRHLYEDTTIATSLSTDPVATSRKFKIKLRNDGRRADTLTLQSAGAPEGLSVRFFEGATEVTNAVRAGTYRAALAPAAARTLTARFKQIGTAPTTSQTISVQATSTKDASKTDRLILSIAAP